MQKYDTTKPELYDSLLFFGLLMIKTVLGDLIIFYNKLIMKKLINHRNRKIYKKIIPLISAVVFYILEIFIFPKNPICYYFFYSYSPKFIWHLLNLEKIDLKTESFKSLSFIMAFWITDFFIILTSPNNIDSIRWNIKAISLFYSYLFLNLQIAKQTEHSIAYRMANQIEPPVTSHITIQTIQSEIPVAHSITIQTNQTEIPIVYLTDNQKTIPIATPIEYIEYLIEPPIENQTETPIAYPAAYFEYNPALGY